MAPDGQRPLPSKRYYDIFSYLATQTAFCFVTAPFVILSFPESLLVWARVYFYTIIGVAVSIAFFASPAKPWLNQQLKQRNRPTLQRKRTDSQESIASHPILGLPNDPAKEFDEAFQEAKAEVEARRRRGSIATTANGKELKKVLEDKLGKKVS